MSSFIDVKNHSMAELAELVAIGEDIIANRQKYAALCQGKILATLFFEPSTRTRLSFESAMLSLGGQVLGFSEAASSSAAKGESLSDTIRTVASYSDIIAMRHPKEGSALLASQVCDVPVVNAGDGGHAHPTQTLTDLLTIQREFGRMDNLTIGICGDLKFGRTVHSLVDALAHNAGVRFIAVSPEELRLPEYTRARLSAEGISLTETDDLEAAMPQLDMLYMTRVQRERFFNEEDYLRLRDRFILDLPKMRLLKQDAIVMHPLPRINEIDSRVDADPRAAYFRQVANGRFVRMALICKLLEVTP